MKGLLGGLVCCVFDVGSVSEGGDIVAVSPVGMHRYIDFICGAGDGGSVTEPGPFRIEYSF